MNNKPNEVRPSGDVLHNLTVFVGVLAALSVAVVILFAGLYGVIYWSFGEEGARYALIAVGVLAFVWLGLRMVATVRHDAMQDAIALIQSMTVHDVTVQQSDDKGEIMRAVAPRLLDIVRQSEGDANKRATSMFQGALNLTKQLPMAGAVMPDDYDYDDNIPTAPTIE